MTWVVGGTSPFGYGFLISDVRVRFPDGEERDLLQKVYPVGNFIAAGFAGSVRIGFLLITNLQRCLRLPDELAAGNAWNPDYVAEKWAPRARRIFENADATEQALGSHILMVGISPKDNLGAPAFPRPHLIRFASPNFNPGRFKKGLRVCHIGSRRKLKALKDSIDHYFRFSTSLGIVGETGGPAMRAQMIAHSMAMHVEETSPKGISPHVHIVICQRGRITKGKNDETRYPADGSGPINFRMPTVATSNAQFVSLCRSFKKATSGGCA
jgi:hypothetical protein